MRRQAFTLIELVVVVAIIGILAAILLPVVNRGPHYGGNARIQSCRSNLKQITLGFEQYLQDYDEKFPPHAVVRSGYWAGSLQPYLKSWQLFQCPSTPKHQTKTTDYFYNDRLAQVDETKLPLPTSTILAGDGSDDAPPSASYHELPDAWRNEQKSPAKRHIDVANYAFVDGHVKYLKPDKVTSEMPKNGVFTFALR